MYDPFIPDIVHERAQAKARTWKLLRRLAAVLLGGAFACAVLYFFFGPRGDLRYMRLRILFDGAAPSHSFHSHSVLTGCDFSELNLRGAYFPSAELRGANFSQARLRQARFLACDLTGACFRDAELRYASLRRCNAEGADLRGADLSFADLARTSLRFALLSGAHLRGCNLTDVELRGTVGLTVEAVLRARNWQLAQFDPALAKALAGAAPQEAFSAAGFSSQESWLTFQESLRTGAERKKNPTPSRRSFRSRVSERRIQ